MFARPTDLADAEVTDALSDGWDLGVVALDYRAVGFGSHHWSVTDGAGRQWFATVDDVDTSGAFDRLRAALLTAYAARDGGAAFVVAPVPSRAGDVVRRMGERYAIALYPHVDGELREGDYEPGADRTAVLELLIALHGADPAAAGVDDFRLANRDALDAAFGELDRVWDGGPYSEPARALLSAHARGVDRLLAHYDRVGAEARDRRDRMVLTRGEPHKSNVIFTERGPVLIDWDTALIAPPERDLWMLESGDGSVCDHYVAVARRRVEPAMLDFYRLQWDLAEIAEYIAEFRSPHGDHANSRAAWTNLAGYLDPAARRPALM